MKLKAKQFRVDDYVIYTQPSKQDTAIEILEEAGVFCKGASDDIIEFDSGDVELARKAFTKHGWTEITC